MSSFMSNAGEDRRFGPSRLWYYNVMVVVNSKGDIPVDTCNMLPVPPAV